MVKNIMIVSLCLFLGACGIQAKVDARNDMQQSKAAYKACLTDNPDKPSNCESLRLAYEADLKAYRATAAGIQPGYNNTVNVNTTHDE